MPHLKFATSSGITGVAFAGYPKSRSHCQVISAEIRPLNHPPAATWVTRGEGTRALAARIVELRIHCAARVFANTFSGCDPGCTAYLLDKDVSTVRGRRIQVQTGRSSEDVQSVAVDPGRDNDAGCFPLR